MVTAAVLQVARQSARSHSRQGRMSSRWVSLANSATERFHDANSCVDGVVDMLEMRAETEDRAPEAIAAVDARATHHDASFLLDVAHQPFVEIVNVAALRHVAKCDDGKLRLGPGIEPVDLRQARVKIAGEREFLG